jgi:hypothetical protein
MRKLEGKGILWRPRCMWVDNSKTSWRNRVVCYGLDWFGIGWGQVESCCKHGNETSGSAKFSAVLEWLRNQRLLKNGSAPWSWLVQYFIDTIDRLCGLVVRVPGYRSRYHGFDSRRYQIFSEVVRLERGPLNLRNTIEELLGRKSSGSGLEIENTAVRIRHTNYVTPSTRKSWN